MAQLHPQRGEGKLGCVIWLLVLAVFVMIAIKVIPIKIASAELYDFMEEQAMFAGRRKPADLKGAILHRAKELELPLNEKNVKVERHGGRIRISADYVVPVEFPGYTYHWQFHHYVDRPVFIV